MPQGFLTRKAIPVSPIKPALSSISRSPAPQTVRQVHCPHCGQRFEASKKAVSLRCPGCTQPMNFEDLTLRRKLNGDLTTMGHVEVSAPSEMAGKLVCGEFTNQGRFEGHAKVFGPVVLDAESLTLGNLEARSLRIVPGATIRGSVKVSPQCAAPARHHSVPLVRDTDQPALRRRPPAGQPQPQVAEGARAVLKRSPALVRDVRRVI